MHKNLLSQNVLSCRDLVCQISLYNLSLVKYEKYSLPSIFHSTTYVMKVFNEAEAQMDMHIENVNGGVILQISHTIVHSQISCTSMMEMRNAIQSRWNLINAIDLH